MDGAGQVTMEEAMEMSLGKFCFHQKCEFQTAQPKGSALNQFPFMAIQRPSYLGTVRKNRNQAFPT